MKIKFIFFVIFSFFISSCSISKRVIKENNKNTAVANKVVANALQYKGVKYKFGGTTSRGMDCSGVLYVAFGKENISLPRVSREMAKSGKNIALYRVNKGDLLFFKTAGRFRPINHVGLVVSVNGHDIQFVHATSSKGVIVSSLNTKYWRTAFVKATRVL